MFNDKDEEKD